VSNHRGQLDVIQDKDTRRVMRLALKAGWEWIGYTKTGHVEIRWPATDQLLHCATTPSDRNAWKAFARSIERVSGVKVRPQVKHGRSRQKTAGPDPEVLASRRRFLAEKAAGQERVRRQREARERQRLAAERAASADQRRREIENLMQPGWGK